LYFKFGDLDSTKPAGSIKIRIETISHYLAKYSPEIIQRKLGYLSADCPLFSTDASFNNARTIVAAR
jgi:predicted nucleotide-binding protein (sugar kinase/HSP70/actin superfamily)